MEANDKPVANPLIVLREEFDDWAILFDPDTGKAFGLNPTAVAVWKLLDGEHSLEDLVQSVRREMEEVPEEAEVHIREFVDSLTRHGLAGFEVGGHGKLPEPGLHHGGQ